ncbi:hypothetical protein GSB9_02303 [Flavobacteriaceae bacterium GSB9]|nr:hypothetical protein GSB9_02303 [Flavobacteriaceae bacterium GSB9]
MFKHLYLLLLCLFYFSIACTEDEKTIEEYTLTTTIIPTNGGSLSDVLDTYKEGDLITLEATPSTNYEFLRWTNHGSGNRNPLKFTINGNTTITAVFGIVDKDQDGVPDNLDDCLLTPTNEFADENGCSISQRDSDGDGVNDNKDICPNTNPNRDVDANGCSIYQRDSDGDNVFDINDKCLNTPINEIADDQGCSSTQIRFNLNLTYGYVFDSDGNQYKTIQIGTQTWMAENLKTTKFSNGELIDKIENQVDWFNIIKPAYCNYMNDETNVIKYGNLYNWYVIKDTRGICPKGWHIPSKAEYTILINYVDDLGFVNNAGTYLKESGHKNWEDYLQIYIGSINSSGFTALPGGYRTSVQGFNSLRRGGYWWTSDTDMSVFRLVYDSHTASFSSFANKQDGLCIRCLKD